NSGTIAKKRNAAAAAQGRPNVQIILARVLALACTLCCSWPAAGSDDNANPRHQLHFDCAGSGTPTVLLDAGLGGSSLEWTFVKEHLRSLTRICTFDRAGYGGSDMGPEPRTSSRITNELYLLLDDAAISPPYVLVGHSFGGYNMQLFARRYPFLVVGLVLIDASHPDQVERFLQPPLGLLTAPSSRWGIVQFREPPPPSRLLPEPIRRSIAAQARRWKTRRTIASELLAFRDSARQLKRAPPHAALPLLVITRGRVEGPRDKKRLLLERMWLELQTELAASSTTSAHLIATEAGHNVHIEQPELVAFGIALLVKRHRYSKTPLHGAKPFSAAPDALRVLEDATWLTDNLELHPERPPTQMTKWDAGDSGIVRPGAP
ncbi:MAG: alpha/beta hydrolase, partial [Gammaproteobacteria bacterium]